MNKMKFFVAFLTMLVGVMILGPVIATAANSPSTDSSISVQTIKGPSVTEKITDKIKESWPWYVARGSGIIAAITLVILMLSGIGQITGQTYRFLEPLTAWASHRALGIVCALSIVAHIVSLLFDKFASFSILDVLLPWFSDFKPVTIFGFNLGSFYLALGIVAFYLSITIVLSSLLFVSKKPKLWKFIHLFSYLAMLLVFFHALILGTDLSHGWAKIVWIVIGNLLSIAVITRTWRAYTA